MASEMRRLLADPAEIDRILKAGAQKARAIATPVMDEVKKRVGFITKRRDEKRSGHWRGERLGRAIVLELAGAGWNVALHYHGSAEDAEKTAAEARALGVKSTLKADLSKEDETAD